MKVKFSAMRELQTFKSIESLNLSMRAFLYRHKHDLSENAIRIYHLLTQHSVKIPGVSFASIKYLCYKAEVSRSTVFRALKKLESLARSNVRRNIAKTAGGHNPSTSFCRKMFLFCLM